MNILLKEYLNNLKYEQICEKIWPKIGQEKYTWDHNTHLPNLWKYKGLFDITELVQ